jgi:hypothetical protein
VGERARGCGETFDWATERLGERARSKAENATSVETTKAGFNRDEMDKGDKGNPKILLRHSGHGRAVSRNPGVNKGSCKGDDLKRKVREGTRRKAQPGIIL